MSQTKTEWHIPEDQRELALMVNGITFATITRWSDNKTGDHAWWAVERFSDGKSLGLCERFSKACNAAMEAAGVLLEYPIDLLAEWGGAAAPEPVNEPPAPLPTLTNAQFARYAMLIAAKSSKWASDILDDTAACPPAGAVERFGKDIAGVLDRLSEVATRKQRS